MGYDINWHGRIEIDPPMPWGLLSLSLAYNFPADHDIRWEMEVERLNTDEGVLTKRRGIALVPREEPYPGVDMAAHVQAVVMLDPTRSYTGSITGVGPDGDHYMVKVVNGVAQQFQGTVVWPEEAR